MKQTPIIILLALTFAIQLSCKKNSVDPEGSFQGITETGPTDPTPIGAVDPDDWKPMMDCGASAYVRLNPGIDTPSPESIPTCTKIFPAYPNPANRSFTVMFTLTESDSVVLVLLSAPSVVARQLVNERLNAGTYSMYVDGSGLPLAIYRVSIRVFRAGDVLTSYGDVKLVE